MQMSRMCNLGTWWSSSFEQASLQAMLEQMSRMCNLGTCCCSSFEQASLLEAQVQSSRLSIQRTCRSNSCWQVWLLAIMELSSRMCSFGIFGSSNSWIKLRYHFGQVGYPHCHLLLSVQSSRNSCSPSNYLQFGYFLHWWLSHIPCLQHWQVSL